MGIFTLSLIYNCRSPTGLKVFQRPWDSAESASWPRPDGRLAWGHRRRTHHSVCAPRMGSGSQGRPRGVAAQTALELCQGPSEPRAGTLHRNAPNARQPDGTITGNVRDGSRCPPAAGPFCVGSFGVPASQQLHKGPFLAGRGPSPRFTVRHSGPAADLPLS